MYNNLFYKDTYRNIKRYSFENDNCLCYGAQLHDRDKPTQ